MKHVLYNTGYFAKEAGNILRLNRLSNIFSFIGTALILFLLGIIVSGWMISDHMVQMLKKEAEISVYVNGDTDAAEASQLVETIKGINGVMDARLVDEDEAYGRMEEVLGEDAHILGLFEENPFESFIEVEIHLEELNPILEEIKRIEGIDHVRDNREVLKRIQNIAGVIKALGLLIIAAVGITTLVIISHIIRQGIYNNRDQIGTLRLLGAPDSFIGIPFVLTGLLLTLGGGILAAALTVFIISRGYAFLSGSLSFIPLPSKNSLITGLWALIPGTGILLGILGSLFGLSSIRNIENG